MAKYWKKRDEFEAVQIKPENTEELKVFTGHDVGFSETKCFLYLGDKWGIASPGRWLVREEPWGPIFVLTDNDFHEQFELSVIIQKNVPMSIRGE